MRTALLSVPPPHSVLSQLSAKRGMPHPGNSEAHRVSQPCPANTGKKYHAHGGSFRPAAAKRFLPSTSRKARNASPRKFRSAPRFAALPRERRQGTSCARRFFPSRRTAFSLPDFPQSAGTPHPGNSEARRVSPPCPANAGKKYHAHDASFRPAGRKAFSPNFPKSAERLTPEIPKRAAFRSLAPQTQARNIMRTAALSVPPPQSVLSQLSEKRRSWPAPRRRFPSAEAAPGGAILESFFQNALEYALKAHTKQKRR